MSLLVFLFIYSVLWVYLRERSHVPETTAWLEPDAGPEFDAEMSRGPGPDLPEDPLLLCGVEQKQRHFNSLWAAAFGVVLQLADLAYLSFRRWRCLRRTWRRSLECWALSCSWTGDGSSSSENWGLLQTFPALDKQQMEEMEKVSSWRKTGQVRKKKHRNLNDSSASSLINVCEKLPLPVNKVQPSGHQCHQEYEP